MSGGTGSTQKHMTTHPPATTLAAWLSRASNVDCTDSADGGDTGGVVALVEVAEPVVSSGDTPGATTACVRGSAVALAAGAADDSFSDTDTDKIAFQFVSHFSRFGKYGRQVGLRR